MKKTAMTQMLDYLDDIFRSDEQISGAMIEKKSKELLEEERRQIEDAYRIGRFTDMKCPIYETTKYYKKHTEVKMRYNHKYNPDQLNGKQYPFGFKSWLKKLSFALIDAGVLTEDNRRPFKFQELDADSWLVYFMEGYSPVNAVDADLKEGGQDD